MKSFELELYVGVVGYYADKFAGGQVGQGGG
jgi:hypothetical protein